MSMPEQKLYIGGRYVDSSSGETFDTVNPANGVVICKVQKANASDVDKAVQSARRGFSTWSRMTGTRRSRVLMRAVAMLRERNLERIIPRTNADADTQLKSVYVELGDVDCPYD